MLVSRLVGRLLRSLRDKKDPVTRGNGISPLKPETKDGHDVDFIAGQWTPVENYYIHRLKNDLQEFSAFARQSRSRLVRDVFAKAATNGRYDFGSLSAKVAQNYEDRALNDLPLGDLDYDPQIAMALASLLIDSAYNDLDTYKGASLFELVLADYGVELFSKRHKLQYVEALAELGEYRQLESLSQLFDVNSLAPLQTELISLDRLARENPNPTTWLERLNELYASLDMTTVSLLEDKSLALLDRLFAKETRNVNGPLVTVIMPTYRPDSGIHTAIRSLLQQTWVNLEIIVVDDGSPESYEEILNEIATVSHKVRVIRQGTNRGAYTARNRGLIEAAGEFITTHDDDDWSHPEKIEAQVSVLLEKAELVATTSPHVRTTPDMHFERVNAQPQHLQTNYSSLMFRKAVVEDIGVWDNVNRGGDSELLLRIAVNYGKRSIHSIKNKPLSFSRVWSGSLTSGEMYRGSFAYSRLLYRWAFRQWHREMKSQGQHPKLARDAKRPFPVPSTFEAGFRNHHLGTFDVVYITDFSHQSRFAPNVLNEIDAAVQADLRVGFMHLASPHTRKPNRIAARLLELQSARAVTQISENDKASAEIAIVYDASIGMFLDEFNTGLEVRRGLVVDVLEASLKGAERRHAAEPSQVLHNLDRSFSTTFQAVGADDEAQRRLQIKLPQDRVLGDEHIWKRPLLAGRKQVRPPKAHPVVGFHTFGNRYRWPSSADTFKAVYVSDAYKSLFFGVTSPVERLAEERLIFEAQIVDHQETTLCDFLEEIDFWIYFPHRRLEDRVWQPVLEAMQAGKVVILPKELKRIYDDGALYAHEKDVPKLVIDYSANPEKYIQQAKLGQAFVAAGYDATSYSARIQDVLRG